MGWWSLSFLSGGALKGVLLYPKATECWILIDMVLWSDFVHSERRDRPLYWWVFLARSICHTSLGIFLDLVVEGSFELCLLVIISKRPNLAKNLELCIWEFSSSCTPLRLFGIPFFQEDIFSVRSIMKADLGHYLLFIFDKWVRCWA